MSAATCGLLWSLTVGPGILKSPRNLRAFRWATFTLALLILVAGIARHTPQRDPFVVAAAGSALGLSSMARMRERQLQQTSVASR